MGEGIGLGGLREGKLSHILCAECPLNFQLSLIQHPLAFHMNQPISRRVGFYKCLPVINACTGKAYITWRSAARKNRLRSILVVRRLAPTDSRSKS